MSTENFHTPRAIWHYNESLKLKCRNTSFGGVVTKLMRSNRPPAKIRFKSYSNRILINFIDPNSLLDFKLSRQSRFQQMDFNQKWSNLIDFFDINRIFEYK